MNELVGTWHLVSTYSERGDGSRIDPVGSNPKGMLVYDALGNMVAVLLGSDRLNFASNDRLNGTDEENRMTVRGTTAYFGRYTVDEAQRCVTHHIECSAFPNWSGTEQRRFFKIAGDNLELSTAPIHDGKGMRTTYVIVRRGR